MGQTLGWFAGEFKRIEALLALLFARSGAPGNALAEQSQAQLIWFVNRDPTIGNDKNDGLTAATALLHVAEIRRRWNGGIEGVRPQLPGNSYEIVIIGDVLAGQEFDDPISVLWDLDVSLGLLMDIEFVPTVKRSGTVLAVPNAFSRTATGQQTVTDAGVADWTSDLDHLFEDTASGAVCWVTTAHAGPALGVLSSAYEGCTAATVQTQINTGLVAAAVAPAESYEILNLAKCYLGQTGELRLGPGSKDTGVTGLAIVMIRRAHGLAQRVLDVLHVEGDAGDLAVQTGANVVFVDCQMDQTRETNSGGVFFLNCSAPQLFPGSDSLTSTQNASSAVLSGYARRGVLCGEGFIVDQDYFVLGVGSFGTGFNTDNGGTSILGDYGRFLEGAAANSMVNLPTGGKVVIEAFFGTGTVYGTTSGNPIAVVHQGGTVLCQKTAANTFNTDGGAGSTFQLGGGTTGFYFNAATSTWLPVGGLTVTITALDTARAAGFGSQAVEPNTGCRILVDGQF